MRQTQVRNVVRYGKRQIERKQNKVRWVEKEKEEMRRQEEKDKEWTERRACR